MGDELANPCNRPRFIRPSSPPKELDYALVGIPKGRCTKFVLRKSARICGCAELLRQRYRKAEVLFATIVT
jgi:hypothetical protein